MPAATVLLRRTGAYARDSFIAGLARIGLAIEDKPKRNPAPDDVIVIWNRVARDGLDVRPYDAAGARVLVAENGYLTSKDRRRFALALGDHNGAGRWPAGGGERFAQLGIELVPWRSAGGHLLMLPQRGIGRPGIAMPPTWSGRVLTALRESTKREVKLRRHPGPDKTDPYEALRGAHAAVTWGSGAAIKALAVGVPVFFDFPQWIGAPAAARLDMAGIESPWLGDRLPMFERLAWAQWDLGEIESGEAFDWLLR